MTEESNQPVDKSNHPPYPDDLQGRQLAPLDETKIPVSKLWNSGVQVPNAAYRTGDCNVKKLSFDFPVRLGDVRGAVTIKLRNIYSGYRKWKQDNNSFNLYNRLGQIALHLSFRRHDQNIVVNTYSDGQWGEEQRINFPPVIVQEKPFNLRITYYDSGNYVLSFDNYSYELYVTELEGPDSLTYRSNVENDAMFGQNVDAEVEWFE